MSHTIEELIEGVWIPIQVFTPTDKFTSKELAEASLHIKRSLRLDGGHLYQPLRIVQTQTPD